MDTIAKSRALDDDYIQSTLQPMCFYDPPFKLVEFVEENRDQYPPSLLAFWDDTGGFVLGRTVYRPQDRFGRNTFFTHQFVAPRENTREIVANLKDYLFVNDFEDAPPEPMVDATLPDLAQLVCDTDAAGFAGVDSALLNLGINEPLFLAILLATLEAVRNGGRVYVAPNVRTGKLPEAAANILKPLLNALPYGYRQKLGFTTYAGAHISLPGVHLYFLERDYASYVRTEALGAFVFDFATRKFWQPADPALLDGIYLRLASQAHDKDRKAFYDFLAAASSGAANMDTLDAVSAFWNLRDSEGMELYRAHREFVLAAMNLSAGKNRALDPVIRELFVKIVDLEDRDRRNNEGYFPSPAVMEQIARYAEARRENETDDKTVAFIAETLATARVVEDEKKSGGGVDYVESCLDAITKHARVFRKVQDALRRDYGQTMESAINAYVAQRLREARDAKGLMGEIEFWLSNNAAAFEDPDVLGVCAERVKAILSVSADKVGDGAAFHDSMERVLRHASAKGDERKTAFNVSKSVLEAADRAVLNSITGETVTIDQLERLRIDTEALLENPKYKILDAFKGFCCSDAAYVMEKSLKALKAQGAHSYARSVEILKRLMRTRVAQENYDKIEALFTDDEGKVAFEAMLDYISESKSRGETCNFINYAFRKGMFGGPHYAEFNNAVVKFFSEFNPKEFKLVLRNFAYLYAGNAKLTDSEQNLKRIMDVFRQRNAVIPRPTSTRDFNSIGTIALVALSIVAGLVLIFALVEIFMN